MRSGRRMVIAMVSLVGVTMVGTVGYLLLGFTLLEALYQTVTTVATVGFREVHPLTPAGQVFTIALIVLGVGTVLYNVGVLVETVTEGQFRGLVERRRMDKRIAGMTGHVIVCGHGRVGSSAREHLSAIGQQVVIVDSNPSELSGVTDPYIIGAATDDAVLVAAGVMRARAIVIALESDADTVYTTLSARALRPDIVIVSRAHTAASRSKMQLAGATRAVNPQSIGGRRLAAFALQPDVAEFMDVVMHDEELDFRIQQLTVAPDSLLAGQTVGAARLAERTGATLLALRPARGRAFIAAPGPESVISVGTVLIVFGTRPQLDALIPLATGPAAGGSAGGSAATS